MPEAPAITTAIEPELARLRLLQLVSAALPIGMYSYSQGLEKAVEDGWLNDERQVEDWLDGLLHQGLARADAPLLARLYDAWHAGDPDRVLAWSRWLVACRETAELRFEDRQTGQALARLLAGLGIAEAEPWVHHPDTCLATSFGLAGTWFGIARPDLLSGYCWSWLENQVLCAMKLVPLGQLAGQRLLLRLAAQIPAVVADSLALGDEDIGGASPALAIASSRHEFQYSRLFRS